MYSSIAKNKRNTVLVMALFIGLVGAIGWAAGYYYGDVSITYTVLVIAGYLYIYSIFHC